MRTSPRGPSANPAADRPEPDPPDGFVLVGRVIRRHGVDGSLRIQSLSDNPNRFSVGARLTVAGESRTIASYQPLPKGHALLQLHGLQDTAGSPALAGEWIFARIDPAETPEPGEYYHYQLIGLSVITDEGERLGTIREILVTGSNDVYVVRSESGPEILLPAISQVVKQIDVPSGTVSVHLLDGLR